MLCMQLPPVAEPATFPCCCVCACRQSRRTGSTVLRDRLLEVSGFSVLPLAYWEWRQRPDDARTSWLEQKLVEAAYRS